MGVLAETSGDGIALNGSDTLKDVTLEILANCDGDPANLGSPHIKAGSVTGHGLSYLGGGSEASAKARWASTPRRSRRCRAP